MSKGFDEFTVMQDMKGYLSPEEVRRVIDGANFGDRLRNKLLIKVLAYTGRRISEIVGLKKKDKPPLTGGLIPNHIDVDNSQILWDIVKKKKPTQQWVPAPPELIDNLITYINLVGIKDNERVFPISRQRAQQIVRQAGEFANINFVGNKRIHPHHFRHSYAVSLIRDGTPIFEIKKLMAHSTIMVTESYLKIAPEDVRLSANKITRLYKKQDKEVTDDTITV